MSYVLYYSPATAAMSVHWALLEMGLPFESVLVDIEQGQQRLPGYLAINPQGRVPTLLIDGTPYTESTALLLLLAERHPERGLAPMAGDPNRAAFLETMVYLANTIMPAMRNWFYAEADCEPAAAHAARELARSHIEGAWERLADRLADGRLYLLGERMTLADFQATTLMRWSRNMPRPATAWPVLDGYIRRMRALPSFLAMNRREGNTDWLNA
jgi:glutathione S-transferase